MIYFSKIKKIFNNFDFLLRDYLAEEENLIIVFNENEKRTLRNKNFFCTATFNEFLLSLLKKYKPEIIPISDIEAVSMIEDICWKELSDNSLKKLISTESFIYQIFELFGRIKNSKNSDIIFDDILSECDVFFADKKRLQELKKVFDCYNEAIENEHFCDRNCYLSLIMRDENIFQKFDGEKIFVILPEKLNFLQIEFFKKMSEKNSLYFYGECEELETVAQELEKKDFVIRNEIAKRAKNLIQKEKILMKKSSDIQYSTSCDEEECADLISDYIKKKKSEKYKNFVVVTSDFSSKQRLANSLSLKEFVINSGENDFVTKNFSIKIERLFEICTILKEAGFKKFSLQELTKLKTLSKSMFEYYVEQLNLYFENLLSEIFEDVYLKNRIVNFNQTQICVLNQVSNNENLLKETDRIKFYELIEFLSALYKMFYEERFFDFANLCGQHYKKKFLIEQDETENFNEFFKHFLAQVYTLQKLFDKNIIKNINPKFILELSKRNYNKKTTDDSVEIIEYSKVQGREFENLIFVMPEEEFLIKRDNNIYFISPSTNEKIAQKTGFKLIEDNRVECNLRETLIRLLCATNKSFFIISNGNEGELFKEMISFDGENVVAPQTECNPKKTRIFQETVNENEKSKCVMDEGELLFLSASSIGNFQTCPRKYFYKNLLEIKGESSFCATYGTIVHSIFEVFGRNCPEKYTRKYMENLSEILFNSPENPKKALDEGFEEFTINLMSATSKLALLEMQSNFYSALEELDKGGFFEKIPLKMETELKFAFKSDLLPNVIFDGKIDSIVEIGENQYNIVDYKTGSEIVKNLHTLFSEETLNFEKFPQKANEYNYQLPIYMIACDEAKEIEKFKGKINETGYIYVRPKSRGGCKNNFVPFSEINEVKEKILTNLLENVVEKIRSTKQFETKPSSFACGNCDYGFICNAEKYDEIEEEA